ncbi:MAG: PDGLE domain-containing protein [Candidatus Planktophila sp.]
MKNKFVAVGLALSLVLAGGVSYYASSHPDGLEKVAGDIGFLDSAKDSAVKDSPLAEYGVAGVENERISGGLAGIIGVATTAAVSFGLFYALRRFKKDKS